MTKTPTHPALGALVGALAGAWIARAAFRWLLDLSDGVVVPALLVGAVLGALLGFGIAGDERRKAGTRALPFPAATASVAAGLLPVCAGVLLLWA